MHPTTRRIQIELNLKRRKWLGAVDIYQEIVEQILDCMIRVGSWLIGPRLGPLGGG